MKNNIILMLGKCEYPETKQIIENGVGTKIVECASTLELIAALKATRTCSAVLIASAISESHKDVIDILQHIHLERPYMPIVLIFSDIQKLDFMFECAKNGACDYIIKNKPINIQMIINKLKMFHRMSEIQLELEQSLADQEMMYQKLVKNRENCIELMTQVGMAFVYLNEETKIVDANEQFYSLMEYKNDASIHSFSIREFVVQRDLDVFNGIWRRISDGNVVKNTEIRLKTKHGNVKFFNVNATRFVNGGVKILFLLQDTTETKQRERRKMIEDARKQDKVRQSLIEIKHHLNIMGDRYCTQEAEKETIETEEG